MKVHDSYDKKEHLLSGEGQKLRIQPTTANHQTEIYYVRKV